LIRRTLTTSFYVASKFNLSTMAFVFPSRNLGPYINTIKKSNSHTLGHLCFNVAVEKEGTRGNNLAPHNHPCRSRRAISDEGISHLRVLHLEQFRTLGVGLLLYTGPVEKARANTKNERLVGVLCIT
jgi:hypothetical protein